MEEEEALRQLARAILDLPVKGGDKKSSTTAAQTLLDECLSAKVELRLRKKSGTASTLGVERGLKQIASRSRTLLKLLKNADRNIFEGWVHAARAEEVGREEAKQEWLQLKSLLEDAAERANLAAKQEIDRRKNWPAPAKGGKRGRPPDELADYISVVAANIYQQRTGEIAYREIGRDDGKP
jgi:hypothetical protein